MAMGAGDEVFPLATLFISTSPPPLLLLALASSCPFNLFSLLLLLSPETDTAPVSDISSSMPFLVGAVQRGISQTTPVKLLRVNPPRAHLRHGLPDRSSARSPALIAPWFALGPNFAACILATA